MSGEEDRSLTFAAIVQQIRDLMDRVIRGHDDRLKKIEEIALGQYGIWYLASVLKSEQERRVEQRDDFDERLDRMEKRLDAMDKKDEEREKLGRERAWSVWQIILTAVVSAVIASGVMVKIFEALSSKAASP